MIIKRLVNLWIIAGLLISGASAAAAQDKVKFSVGVGTKTPGTSLLWLANQERFLRGSRLDVQPVLLRGTPVAVQALVGESLYITMSSADAMVSAAAGGADLVSVAGVVNGLTQAIVANKKYGSIKELRGTIVGVQSLASGATTVLKRIFSRTASTIRPITSRLLSAAATSILRR